MSDVNSWPEWVSHHRRLFALHPESTAMLAEWAGLFELAGWTPSELRAASDWLAMHAPPKKPSEHLQALQDCVRGKRFEAVRRLEQDDPRGTCRDCGGSGRVIVPHLRCAVAQPVSWYTLAVACSCALGDWYLRHGGYLSLGDYERVVPDWRERIAEHERWQEEQRRVSANTRVFDGVLGRIKARQLAAGGES